MESFRNAKWDLEVVGSPANSESLLKLPLTHPMGLPEKCTYCITDQLTLSAVPHSDWHCTLLCCFSAQAATYKSSYSLVSSLKDSGHIRPEGACVKCSCCQHDCGHSRGQWHSDPLAKERVPPFNTTNRGLSFTLTHILTWVHFHPNNLTIRFYTHTQ